MRPLLWGCLAVMLAPSPGSGAEVSPATGLLALYEFAEASGDVVKDVSGVGKPLDLRIADPGAVRRKSGSLEIRKGVLIRSETAATKIIQAVKRSGELTLETWLAPAALDQKGPARILTLSVDSSSRNVTLGQDGDRYDVRLRTTKTSGNGIPSLATSGGAVKAALTHVVYTRDRGGNARIFVNGRPAAQKRVAGSLSNWNDGYRLGLANEISGDRPWRGRLERVAIYGRALIPAEIREHHEAGPATPLTLARNGQTAERRAGERLFHQSIAPLFTRHCLECHDPANREGRLDLTQRDVVLKGDRKGPFLVPGKSGESRLWEVVHSNAMPEDRAPLSDAEKALLKRWIDGGAVWPVPTLDPVLYSRDPGLAGNWVRRLTLDEYIATVQAALGVDIAEEAREWLPRDLRADGFGNTAYNLNIDLKHVEAYARLAAAVVAKLDTVAFAGRFSKSRLLTDKSMRALIADMGKWLLRGPLEEHEIVVYRGISTTVASAGGDFEEAVGYIVEAMLQSPRFLYRMENQRGATSLPVTDYELASRLSYLVWGASPDAELMSQADEGRLYAEEAITRQVRRMLRDPRALEQALRFVSEWLDLDRLDHLRPGEKMFPDWKPQLADDMRRETLLFFQDVVWDQERPLSDLLNAQVTHVTPRLARHYRMPVPAGAAGDPGKPVRMDVSAVASRGGLLTQGSILTVGGDEASMVTRGLFVLKDLLRGVVQDPPPCVDTTPVPAESGRSRRGIAEGRIANLSCGGCHVRFEPLAFGLEKYDGLGAFHEKDEHGNAQREDGEILVPLTGKAVAYQTSRELMDLLAGSERVRESITWKLVQFALGRPLIGPDAPEVQAIHAAAWQEGGTYASLIRAIALSDLVRLTRAEAVAAAVPAKSR